VKINYEFPTWCGKPPPGTHLDVLKDDKLIEKLLIDEKKYYIFGRNNEMCDFVTSHASCSRAHAAIMYHKVLNKAFIVDLKSAHGTYIGYRRLEPHVPIQLPADVQLQLGESTRRYVFKNKPLETTKRQQEIELPEEEEDLDNLTEYNTARNKKIVKMPVEEPQEQSTVPRAKKRKSVTWNKEEDVINPEDVDPSIGKFRNSCTVKIIPAKRKNNALPLHAVPQPKRIASQLHTTNTETALYTNVTKLPDITSAPDPDTIPELPASFFDKNVKPGEFESKSTKKIFEKEAWPGRKPNEKSENFGI